MWYSLCHKPYHTSCWKVSKIFQKCHQTSHEYWLKVNLQRGLLFFKSWLPFQREAELKMTELPQLKYMFTYSSLYCVYILLHILFQGSREDLLNTVVSIYHSVYLPLFYDEKRIYYGWRHNIERVSMCKELKFRFAYAIE